MVHFSQQGKSLASLFNSLFVDSFVFWWEWFWTLVVSWVWINLFVVYLFVGCSTGSGNKLDHSCNISTNKPAYYWGLHWHQDFLSGSKSQRSGYFGVPESEKGLLGESGAGRGHGEDEGGESEGAVDGHEAGPEGGGGRLAAEQQQETEEPSDELEEDILNEQIWFREMPRTPRTSHVDILFIMVLI